MNRELISEKKDREQYAREELHAELASTFLAIDLGIPMNTTNHAAYVQSWVKALKDDKKEIFKASNDAVQIADYVKSFMPQRFKEKDVLIEAPEGVVVDAEPIAPLPPSAAKKSPKPSKRTRRKAQKDPQDRRKAWHRLLLLRKGKNTQDVADNKKESSLLSQPTGTRCLQLRGTLL